MALHTRIPAWWLGQESAGMRGAVAHVWHAVRATTQIAEGWQGAYGFPLDKRARDIRSGLPVARPPGDCFLPSHRRQHLRQRRRILRDVHLARAAGERQPAAVSGPGKETPRSRVERRVEL